MGSNANLHKARCAKNDEFYTQLVDIENELIYYKEHFKDKVVYCNCDDPYKSNFFKYFVINFNHLGLKKLICTCYAGSQLAYTQSSLFRDEEEIIEESSDKKPYKIEITHVDDLNIDDAVDLTNVELLLRSVDGKPTLLEGDGDFRSQECIEILKQSDIVVTNPPFSLFREYVAQLVAYDKKFVIIGNMNAITYKEVFPLLRDNKVWIGNKQFSDGMNMIYPPHLFDATKVKKYFVDDDGNYIIKIMGVIWFTNLDIARKHKRLVLWKSYTPEEYPHYDNYDAINVDKLSDIPCDYGGVIGVPITFLDKYNPEQFEILGLSSYIGCDTLDFFHRVPDNIQKQLVGGNAWMPILHTNKCYKYSYRRLFIRRKKDGK